MQETQPFIVVARSSNTNSFGLYGMVLVNRAGHGYEVAANHLNARSVNDLVRVPIDASGAPLWERMGYELPRSLGTVPEAVRQEVSEALDKAIANVV